MEIGYGVTIVFLIGAVIYLALTSRKIPPAPEPGKLTAEEISEIVKQVADGLSNGIRSTLGYGMVGEVVSPAEDEPDQPIYIPDHDDPFINLTESNGWLLPMQTDNGSQSEKQQNDPLT